MKSFFAGAAVIALLALSVSCRLPPAEAPFSKVPDFTLPALAGGKPVVFSEVNRENPVLLVFWATWCPSCEEEIPALNEIQKKFSSQGLRILAVNVEESGQAVQDFQKNHPMNYPVLLDEKGKVTNQFGLAGVPVLVLAQKGGNVLYFGFSLPADLEKLLQKGKP